MSTLPLAITTDDLLLDEVLRVATAAGVDVHASDAGPDAAARWVAAPFVLVGEDALARLAVPGWPRRSGVVVVARGSGTDDPRLWRAAVAIGAEHVVSLPDGERWLVDRLGEVADAALAPASVVTVVAGRGGAGASTYCLLLARAAADDVMVIDVDSLGGGLESRMDGTGAPGLRWPDLAAVSGRLSARTLRAAVPRISDVALLSMTARDPAPLPVEAFSSVLDAAVRGGGLVIVDAPRDLSAVSRLAWARSDVVVVVTPDDPPGVVASRALVDAVAAGGARVVALVRHGREVGLHPEDVAEALGVDILAGWRHDRLLARGEPVGVVSRRACRAVTAPLLSLLHGRSIGHRAA